MAEPRVLMFDQPSLGLAPRIVLEILGIVRGLRDDGIATRHERQDAVLLVQSAHSRKGVVGIAGCRWSLFQ
jgi:branched-chain amino acid transport system ATP-binding protein